MRGPAQRKVGGLAGVADAGVERALFAEGEQPRTVLVGGAGPPPPARRRLLLAERILGDELKPGQTVNLDSEGDGLLVS
ncbi:hypothetical protein ACTMTJ_34050 [Phytohabitans sp. LJ34]|uniref:hypothetical protein n=1 Tax=Phytohabitans sp. LJ34 TaxID=3452217 RepID=UPI003F8B9A44